VTGGSRGIGKAICELLATQSTDVCVNYTSDSSKTLAEKVVATVVAAGSRAIAVRADVSKASDVTRLFAETEAKLGPVTGLVNNAAIIGPKHRYWKHQWRI
jgi:NAD(P)-dependent dehydrogenase (short-subunit alcohol dehydrogenase family)